MAIFRKPGNVSLRTSSRLAESSAATSPMPVIFAARASQAINQARRNRVGTCDRNHRDIRAVFDDTSRSVGVRDHYVCLALQVVNEPRQSVRVCFSCPPPTLESGESK